MRDQAAVDSKLLPRFNMKVVKAAYERLMETLMPLAGLSVSTEMYDEAVQTVRGLLPEQVDKHVVSSALASFTLFAPTEEQIEFVCRRLAGNINEMRAGRSISLTRGSAPNGWCACRIAEAEDVATQKGDRIRFHLKVLAGPWSGDEVQMTVSPKYVWVIAVNLGFAKWKREGGATNYAGPKDLSGMQIMAKVESLEEDCKFGPAVSAFGAASWQLKMNRDIMHGRAGTCPHGILRTPCWRCEKGRNECAFAYREFSLVRKLCTNCNEENLHDPRHPRACIRCNMRHWAARRKEFQDKAK